MKPHPFLASAVSFALLAAAASGADWPCYLGANRDLIPTEMSWKLWSGDTARVLWKENLGQGIRLWSSLTRGCIVAIRAGIWSAWICDNSAPQ